MTASTYRRTPVKVTVSKKSQASRASAGGAEEAGPGGSGALGRRVDPGLLQDLPHGGGGSLDAEDEQLAVDAAVPPARILCCQAQHQLTKTVTDRWPAGSRVWIGPMPVDQLPVPAQHCVRPDQQPEPAQHVMGAENLCHQAILMNHAPCAVTPLDPELIQVCNAVG